MRRPELLQPGGRCKKPTATRESYADITFDKEYRFSLEGDMFEIYHPGNAHSQETPSRSAAWGTHPRWQILDLTPLSPLLASPIAHFSRPTDSEQNKPIIY
jgi:hypothetical protein